MRRRLDFGPRFRARFSWTGRPVTWYEARAVEFSRGHRRGIVMRNFLAFVGAAIVVFLALGWYLGWYNITPEKSDAGKSRIQIDINKDKINADVKRGAENVEGFIEKQKNSDPSKPADPKAADKD